MRVCVLSRFVVSELCVTPGTVAHQASLSTDSPGKNTGVDCRDLLPGDLPDPGIKPASFISPALEGRSCYH